MTPENQAMIVNNASLRKSFRIGAKTNRNKSTIIIGFCQNLYFSKKIVFDINRRGNPILKSLS